MRERTADDTPTDPTDADPTDTALTDAESLARTLEILRTETARLRARVETLESETDRLREENAALREENEALRERVEELECRSDSLESTTETLESESKRLEAKTTAALNRSGANRNRVGELQARELEKGAHLRAEHVDPHEIELAADHLERIRKDDGRRYYRVPDSEDPLGRGGNVALAHADLLPIQQLARMDEDMLRSTTNALPTRLAATLWKARTDPTVGDDPWRTGCKNVRASVKASDLKHWIRRQEAGVSDAYAKKLVSRTIDALLELSDHRLAVTRRRERKNGLEYVERRVVIPADAEIPGETTSAGAPETPGVTG